MFNDVLSISMTILLDAIMLGMLFHLPTLDNNTVQFKAITCGNAVCNWNIYIYTFENVPWKM